MWWKHVSVIVLYLYLFLFQAEASWRNIASVQSVRENQLFWLWLGWLALTDWWCTAFNEPELFLAMLFYVFGVVIARKVWMRPLKKRSPLSLLPARCLRFSKPWGGQKLMSCILDWQLGCSALRGGTLLLSYLKKGGLGRFMLLLKEI